MRWISSESYNKTHLKVDELKGRKKERLTSGGRKGEVLKDIIFSGRWIKKETSENHVVWPCLASAT